MASNLSGLVNNISGSISNAVDQFSGKSKNIAPYPDENFAKDIQTRVIPANWNHLVFPYSFAVMKLDGTQAFSFDEFQLPLAPTSITQDETPAIKITPTQGGTVTTHSGVKYKDLVIEGTTGVAPFRGSGGVDKRTGQGILQPADMKYRSGYEVFQHLRNYFKTYYAYKNHTDDAHMDERLVFKNYKDGEFLIVELLKFNMVRNAARPMEYNYKLEFKVLSHFKFQVYSAGGWLAKFDSIYNDALSKIDLARGSLLRLQGLLKQIENTYEGVVLEPLRKISLAIKTLKNIPKLAGDIGRRIVKNTVNEVRALGVLTKLRDKQKENSISGGGDPRIIAVSLPTDLKSAVSNKKSDVISDLGEALMAISIDEFPESTRNAVNEESVENSKLPRSFYLDTITDLERIQANAEDKFNLSAPILDDLFNRTSTVTAESVKSVTDDEFFLLQALGDAISGINALISYDILFKSSYDQRIKDTMASFDGQLQLQSLPAVRQIIVSRDDTLERIAQKELNNTDRWVEIVEVNNLKAPYITNDHSSTLDDVVKPGDTLLIPVNIQSGFSELPKGAKNPITNDLTELEQSLGVDFKLTDDFDLSLNNSNDLDVVAGANNISQAVLLKLFYEKGELLHAVELGVGLLIGNKISRLDDIKDAVVSTLLQDSRINKIKDLSLIRDNSSIRLAFNIYIKQVDIPIPVKIRL